MIVQPENKETGPGLILPLIHLYKRYPESLVLVLPSDHFIGEEERLMGHARMACLAVKRDPSRLILLGVKPDRDEPEYGYLLPNKNHLPSRTGYVSKSPGLSRSRIQRPPVASLEPAGCGIQ